MMKYGHLITGLFLTCTLSTTHASNAQQVTATKVSSDYAKTKYPIVFAHGMAGFIRVGDVLGLDYWYQILPNLARNGASTWATRVSPFNSTEVRGEQLAQQVEEILAITGSQKVNLVGHSHGGPTSRYVAGVMPTRVASVTAIGSPQRGSPVADIILSTEGTVLEGPVVSLVNLFSKAIVWAQGLDPKSFPHDALAGGKSVTTEGSVLFNRKFPMGVGATACSEGAYQEKGIQFFSFTGNTAVTNLLDLDSALLGTSLLINLGHDNDGLVSRCSAKFGRTIRDNYRWNHLDEINQFLGLRALFAPDPVQVYREHANRLKVQGL